LSRPPFQIFEFVGQREAMLPVLREQDGAQTRGEPLPPLLFTGASGSGKSLAARMLSKRVGTNIEKFNGAESVEGVAERLRTMKLCDVALFDECHRLSDDVQEMLYAVIDSSKIPAKLTKARSQEDITITPITLIFATDQPGRLLNALHKRIPTTVRFKPYRDEEMKEIVSRVAKRRGVLLSAQAAGRVARVCNGLPRRADHHVQRIRLNFEDSERRQLGLSDVQEYLAARGIDADGLGPDERDYLQFLGQNGSASLEALAGHLGVDAEFIRTQVEQPLRYRRLITVQSSGRVLTPDGQKWLGSAEVASKNERE
jgi:Holliday junction DNA helicase RuvB